MCIQVNTIQLCALCFINVQLNVIRSSQHIFRRYLQVLNVTYWIELDVKNH